MQEELKVTDYVPEDPTEKEAPVENISEQKEESSNTELVALDKINPIVVFSTQGGLDPIIEAIRTRAIEERKGLDISTAEGRTKINSLARRIGSSKKALETMALSLTEDWRKKTAEVNAEKKRMCEAVDAIRDEIKEELNQYNLKEKERTGRHEARIQSMRELAVFPEGFQSTTSDKIKENIAVLEALYSKGFNETKYDWQEFHSKATGVRDDVADKLKLILEARLKYEKEQEELERHRKEAEERERQEREERLKKEAAEQARKEAEEKAEREKAEAEAKAKAEQERLEKERREAAERAEKAERDRVAAEEKAKRDAEEAAKKAEEEKQAAIEAERQRVADEKRKQEAEIQKREADKKHRAKINNEALQVLKNIGLDDLTAKKVIEAIAKGQVPNISIRY